jgi:hypothetical protein
MWKREWKFKKENWSRVFKKIEQTIALYGEKKIS